MPNLFMGAVYAQEGNNKVIYEYNPKDGSYTYPIRNGAQAMHAVNPSPLSLSMQAPASMINNNPKVPYMPLPGSTLFRFAETDLNKVNPAYKIHPFSTNDVVVPKDQLPIFPLNKPYQDKWRITKVTPYNGGYIYDVRAWRTEKPKPQKVWGLDFLDGVFKEMDAPKKPDPIPRGNNLTEPILRR